jgi:hypothetical protein
MTNASRRAIPGCPGYFVTRGGRVWSDLSQKWLKPDPHRQGYSRVTLRVAGRTVRHLVHRLVALAWIGPAPFAGAKVLHKNDDRTNNAASNLYYGTQAQNMRDAVRNGLMPHIFTTYGVSRGEANGNSKLKVAQVIEIKAALRSRASVGQLAANYAVSRATIEQIRAGRTWHHIN